jgi:hypothetical protein
MHAPIDRLAELTLRILERVEICRRRIEQKSNFVACTVLDDAELSRQHREQLLEMVARKRRDALAEADKLHDEALADIARCAEISPPPRS